MNAESLGRAIDQGTGQSEADQVLKCGRLFDLVTGELQSTDIAGGGDRIVGMFVEYRGRTEVAARGHAPKL